MSTSLRKHVNQLVHTETANLAFEQIADPWLGLAKKLGRLRLRPLLIVNVLSQIEEQVCTDLEIRRLRSGEPQIFKNIVTAINNLYLSLLF